MKRQKCSWKYLFRAEDSSSGTRDCLAHMTSLLRAGKAVLWLGVSILLGMGLGQLG
jgi:hypothetical protein